MSGLGAWDGSIAGAVEYSYSNRLLPLTVQPQGIPGQANGYAASYGWDADKLLSSIAPVGSSTVPTLSFARSSLDGHVTGTTVGTAPSTVTTSYDVDVSAGTPGTGDLEGMTASVASTQIFSVSYQRDDLGRIERLDETVLGTSITRKYAYDGAGRLISVLDGSDAVISEYEYDGNGARTRALTPSGEVELGTDLGCGVGLAAPVDAQDRLCRYGDYEYVYDDNGRLFSKTNVSTSAETQYTYDALGQLRSVVLPDTTQIDYVHDALGRRVGKVVGDGVDGTLEKGWRYGVGSLQPLAQLDSAGLIEKTFVYGTRVNVPELIVDHVDGATYRVIVDHLGSVRLVVNVATGDVAQQMGYDEFGNVLVDTNPGWQPFGFAGGLYDADTGLVRFGARDYDAVTGRWTAKDPIGFAGGDTNLYAYCFNDPVNLIDPTGTIVPLLLGGAVGGAAAGAIAGAVGGAAKALASGQGWDGALAGAGKGALIGAGVGAVTGALAATAVLPTLYVLAGGAEVAVGTQLAAGAAFGFAGAKLPGPAGALFGTLWPPSKASGDDGGTAPLCGPGNGGR